MEGLSKEELKDKFLHYCWSTDDDRQLLTALMFECKELNPWLPIVDAPKDRRIVLWYPKPKNKSVGVWDKEVGDWWIDNYGYSTLHQPTLWQELPADPK